MKTCKRRNSISISCSGKHKDNSSLSKEQKQFSRSCGQSNCDFLKNSLQEKELDRDWRRTDSHLNTRWENSEQNTNASEESHHRPMASNHLIETFHYKWPGVCSNTNIIFSFSSKERRVDADHQHHIALPPSLLSKRGQITFPNQNPWRSMQCSINTLQYLHLSNSSPFVFTLEPLHFLQNKLLLTLPNSSNNILSYSNFPHPQNIHSLTSDHQHQSIICLTNSEKSEKQEKFKIRPDEYRFHKIKIFPMKNSSEE